MSASGQKQQVGTGEAPGDLPGLAIIANSYTPYRIHLHQRIAREIPELRLWSLFTHEQSAGANWQLQVPSEINPISFGPGESTVRQGKLRWALHEWRKAGRIIRWLADHRIRAVVVMGYNDAGRVRIIRWCHAHGLPCFIAGDSNIRVDRARGIKRIIKRALLSRLLRWTSGALPSGTAGEAYFRRYRVPPQRIFLFPLEPDYQEIQSIDKAEIQDAARRFGLAAQRRRIVFVARFVDWKRGDLLIDAFARLAAQRPQWDLLMIGDGPMRPAWEARLPQVLRDRVIWTGYVSDQRQVSAMYRSCDVLVLPSEGEPWALVVNEAAAAGLAIVCSSDPGAAIELVRDNVNGRIFPIGDLDALTQALLEVTAPDRIDAMKTASRCVLDDWRARADPVRGLRQALTTCRVLLEEHCNSSQKQEAIGHPSGRFD